ncbi:BTB/POZ domain and ankyrin repeat-containing protein NPR2 [Populus alba x Populus x berolinensis]|nr:BTB/POZ domain and ankyrin repeat-containing protein NPR2 [Populus alba x Populus x berolinensis]
MCPQTYKEANKDRLCTDILEREMRRNPMAGSASITSHTMDDDLHMKLVVVYITVAFARLFVPTEVKLAMDIGHAATTPEFAGLAASKGSDGNLREVDPDETPITQNIRLRSRMEALTKTVEMGRRYFPNCSEVLDKFMEDDLPDLFYHEKGTPDEQRIKKTRFMELKEDVQGHLSRTRLRLTH